MDTFPLILEKLVVKDGREWCLDVLDRFVAAGQSVSVGEAVVRRYRPVSAGHNHVVLGIYSSDSPDVQVILPGYKINRTREGHIYRKPLKGSSRGPSCKDLRRRIHSEIYYSATSQTILATGVNTVV